jgi:environmental stress-induced protein Ves
MHASATPRTRPIIERFDLNDVPAVPWKNGGGTTREIVCLPAGAGFDDFAWRASVATIAADGPFSVFPGVDRSITLLCGGGVHLRALDGDLDHRLDGPCEPFAFDGGRPVHAALLDGESQDFNVMTRRGRCRAEVRGLRTQAALGPLASGLLHAATGEWEVDGPEAYAGTLRGGQGLWWHDAPPATLRVSPRTRDAALLVVDIRPPAPGDVQGARR